MRQVAMVAYEAAEGEGCVMAWDLPTLTPMQMQLKEVRMCNSEWACLLPSGLDDTHLVSLFHSDLHSKTANAILVHQLGRERPVLRSFGQDKLTACAWLTEDQVVVGSETGKLCAWSLETGAKLWQVEDAHLGRITLIRRTLRGDLVTVSEDGYLKVWLNHASPCLSFSLEIPHVAALRVCGNRLYVASEKCILVYDMLDQQLLARLHHPSLVTGLAIDATECIILAASEKVIHIWDLTAIDTDSPLYAQATPTYQLTGHQSSVISMEITFDGQHALSVDQAGGLCLWDLPTRSMLKRLDTPPRGYNKATGLWLTKNPSGSTRKLASQLQREVSVAGVKVQLKSKEEVKITPAVQNEDYERLKVAYAKLLKETALSL